MNLPKSPLHSFRARLNQLFSHTLAGKDRPSSIAEPDVKKRNRTAGKEPQARTAASSPSDVQIALMQRMGVTGRPLMEACKRRSTST